MNKEGIKDFLIVNGEIKKIEDTDIFKNIIKPPIYEVIRVIDGIPIFLEEHLERLKESSRRANYSFSRNENEIKNDINKLITVNNVENLNIKLLYTKIEKGKDVLLVYFIESYYPKPELYRKGIHTILFDYERENPNIKITDNNFKEKVKRRLNETSAFEAILVNKDGYITEGSRSNIFFTKENIVYTASGKNVLLGITRKKVFEVCDELNIKIIENNIHLEELDNIDGAFITGTSINVLPISIIGNKEINSVNTNVIKKISEGYMRKIEDYLQTK